MSYSSEVLSDAPRLFWRFGETSGTTAADASGNANSGSYASVTLGAPSLLTGDTNPAATFDGSTSVVSSAYRDAGAASYSVEAWVKTSGAGASFRHVAGWRGSIATAHIGYLYLEDNVPKFAVFNTSSAGFAASGAAPIADGQAHHLVGVLDGSTIRLYVDGVEAGTGALAGAARSVISANGFTAGADSTNAREFAGVIDEVAAYGVALSPARIAAHHAAGTGSVPTVTASLAGALRPMVGAFAADVPASLSLAGAMPRMMGAFSTAAPAPVESTPIALAGEMSRPVATFTAQPEVPVVPAPGVVALSGHAVVVAQAFGPVTMRGTQPVYSISQAAVPRARQRVVVDGQDVTYFRGGILPDVTYTLVEPLLYGTGTLEVPQVSACFERIGEGELSWLRPGAPVEVQRVVDDVVVGTDYKGVVVAFDTAGRTLSVELGGEASGRAALRNRQVPIFPRRNDLGHQIDDAVRDLGLPTLPHLGPVTGIEAMTTGGTGHLEHIQNLVAKAFTKAGRQWTVMPDEFGVYRTFIKDTTTIHGTVFADDTRTVANLRRDISEEPNRIFGTGVTPAGQRVKNGVYPGLIQGPVPPFPGLMRDGDTGEGVRLLIGRLQAVGYIGLRDVEGGYDDDVHDAVLELQTDAGLFDDGFGDTPPGWVDEPTWRALYDLDVTGGSLEWAHVEPMAQRRKVRKWKRSGSGTILGLNPVYDPDALVVDRNIDFGSGLKRRQMFNRSKAELHDSDEPNWVGDITFNTGALIRGEKAIGATLTEADVMDARELQPGMNLWLPQFDGGTIVHVSACQVDGEGTVTATVDTRFRDSMEVWEVIARNRESRRDPARNRDRAHRSSTIIKDSIGEWDEIGGLLGNDVALEAGWNVVKVVGAAEGTISRIRLLVQTVSGTTVDGEGGSIGVEPHEFACAVFGREVGRGDLTNLVPQPLTAEGKKAWRRKATRDQLKAKWLLYSAGTDEEPCGYGSDLKSDGAMLTGEHDDDAGFAYRSEERAWLWLAVWVAEPTTLHQGRVMWPQLEAGV